MRPRERCPVQCKAVTHALDVRIRARGISKSHCHVHAPLGPLERLRVLGEEADVRVDGRVERVDERQCVLARVLLAVGLVFLGQEAHSALNPEQAPAVG